MSIPQIINLIVLPVLIFRDKERKNRTLLSVLFAIVQVFKLEL